MAAGARTDGGNQHHQQQQQQQQQRQTSTQVRKVILSLKEVVGNHSDADIYAALKESNMDPNETAQKLLNQDPFHEVKRKRDKKKELTGYVGFSDARRRMGYNLQSAKPHMTWDRNVQRRDYNRNTLPDAGSNREIRVVREYRVKENVKRDDNPGSVHNSASEEEQSKFNLQDISSIEVLADQKQSATRNSEGLMPSVGQPCDSVAGHTKGVVPTSTSLSLQLGKTQATASTLNSQTQREGKDSSKENSSLTLSNSVVGVYSSASDPVHVPSPASRPSGTVGAIRREVGVVGVRKQSSYQPATNSAVPNSSFSVPLSAKDISSTKESFEQSVGTPKQNQVVVSDPVISNGSTSRSFSGSQHNIKVAQQSSGHQKAMQSTMEWKPKTSQKPTVISPIVSAHTRSSCAEDASSSNPADVSNLSKKLSQVNVLEEPERHVIIPQHLQVPESEYTKLTFGSFAAGFDSTKSFSSACQALEDEELCDEPSVSLSASVPVSPIENTSADDQVNMSACQARTSRSESPASAAETEQSPSGNTESLNHQDIENYADIGLVESQSPPYSSPQTQQLPTPASLPTFSAYEPRSSYGIPFFRNVAEDNIHGQGFSSSEALSLHATNNSSSSVAALTQLQPQSMQQQQQQQPVTNLYPQVHFSHFPNFVPYRHIFSPVYVPPMAIPNYSNNPAYPHPSNGSNYFLMPGGSSHIPAGGVKYAPSQYKTVPSGNPSGYGNYTNPTGFTINPPGSVGGATALEDVNRPRYKDNNLYIPNPQAETSDMWLQTPRELPGLQPASYYNLPGQQPHAAAAAAAFMPAAHGGHASFNAAAAQSSHVQYPTLYHPSPSPASLTAPHHLVHQSGIGGSIGGVGMVAAAPGSQVGAYQQPQLSHTNWPTNF